MGRYLTEHATNEEVVAEILRDAIDDLRAFNEKWQEMTTEQCEVALGVQEIVLQTKQAIARDPNKKRRLIAIAFASIKAFLEHREERREDMLWAESVLPDLDPNPFKEKSASAPPRWLAR